MACLCTYSATRKALFLITLNNFQDHLTTVVKYHTATCEKIVYCANASRVFSAIAEFLIDLLAGNFGLYSYTDIPKTVHDFPRIDTTPVNVTNGKRRA